MLIWGGEGGLKGGLRRGGIRGEERFVDFVVRLVV